MFYTKPLFRRVTAAALLAVVAAPLRAQETTPTLASNARAVLDGYIAEALQANLALAQQRAAERRADAGVREANGRFLPSLGLNARYSEFSGVVNIGDFINPAYDTIGKPPLRPAM